MWKILAGFFVNLGKAWILKPLATAFGILFMWGFNALVKASPGRAAYIAQKVTETYFDMTSPWAQFVASYTEQLTGRRIDVSELVGRSVGAITDGPNRAFVDRFFNDMLSMVMPSPEEAERNPLDGAERYLAANLKFQMDAWWLHMLGDMQSFGIFKSLKDLPNAISWAFGLGWLSWLVMGVPFRMGIADPMERFFNRIYTPTELTISQLIDAYQKGIIPLGELYDRALKLGYHPDKLIQLIEVSEKELSRSDIEKLYEQGLLTKDEVESLLERQGYYLGARRAISELITRKRELDIADDIIKAAIKLFEKGDIEESQLREYLDTAGWKRADIDRQVAASRMQKRAGAGLSNTDIARAVNKDLIGWSTAVAQLRDRGFTIDEAEIFLKLRVEPDKWF